MLALLHRAGQPLPVSEITSLRLTHEAMIVGAEAFVRHQLRNLRKGWPGREEPHDPRVRIPDMERMLETLRIFGMVASIMDSSMTLLYHLTPEGKRLADRVEKGRRVLVRPTEEGLTQVFVASAFGRQDVDQLYDTELKRACASCGLEPYRVDLSEPDDTISAAIMDNIASARAMIADLTYARPSVYFEVGYAQALGLPVVLTCRADHYRGKAADQQVHFDLAQFKISFWTVRRGKIEWPPRMNPAVRLRAVLRNAA